MGGVDKFDQYKNYYPSGHHAKKWWKLLFFNLLDMAITNSYICYKNNHDNVSLLDFRDNIVNELFHKVDIRKKRSAMDEPSTHGPSISIHNEHVLINSGKSSICLLCKKEGRKAPKGAILTKFKCTKCNKGFCYFAKRDYFNVYQNNL